MTIPFLAAGDNPLAHVLDRDSAITIGGTVLPLSVVSLVVGSIVCIGALWLAASRISTGPASEGNARFVTRGRLAQVVEVLVLALRDQMLVPVMGERLAKRWLPLLLSLFFFILTLNLFGLVPFADLQELFHVVMGNHGAAEADAAAAQPSTVFFGGTATACFSVTLGLSAISFVAIWAQSIRDLGIKGTLEHLCGGHDLVHGPLGLWLVIPIIFAVELAGMFIKPAALAIRLLANMVAGHTLMAVLFGFGAAVLKAGGPMWAAGSITAVAGIFAVLITFLELFVAFLQAFIFMFLTAVFISLMAHEDHGHEEHDHGGHAEPSPAH
jgi:F-type H+-transporting ATPase subunit a